eukprot:IDg7638t1
MPRERVALFHFSDRATLDRERLCVWIEDATHLYNDVRLKPVIVDILIGGATRNAIRGIDPSRLLHEHRDQKMKGQFGVIRSRPMTAIDNYFRSEEWDPELFLNFCSYWTWMLNDLKRNLKDEHPVMKPYMKEFTDAIRSAVCSDSQTPSPRRTSLERRLALSK